ncbi:MAG: sigma-70 family RNA polymerase sigma factor [Actinomycetota bacterium]
MSDTLPFATPADDEADAIGVGADGARIASRLAETFAALARLEGVTTGEVVTLLGFAREHLERRLERESADHARAAAALVETHLPLVHRIARRMQVPTHVDGDDLVQWGALGLIDAAGKFDAARGLKFATYAANRIRGAMLDGLRSIDPVPRLARSRGRRIAEARRETSAELGRAATDEDLAAPLGVDLEHLGEQLRAATVAGTSSLDVEVGVRPDPARAERERELWRALLRGLNRQERLLLILYYRLGQTMRQTGAHLGLSESRVSQMHTAILERRREEGEAFARNLEGIAA